MRHVHGEADGLGARGVAPVVSHRVADDLGTVHRADQLPAVVVPGQRVDPGEIGAGRNEQPVVGQEAGVDQLAHGRADDHRVEVLGESPAVEPDRSRRETEYDGFGVVFQGRRPGRARRVMAFVCEDVIERLDVIQPADERRDGGHLDREPVSGWMPGLDHAGMQTHTFECLDRLVEQLLAVHQQRAAFAAVHHAEDGRDYHQALAGPRGGDEQHPPPSRVHVHPRGQEHILLIVAELDHQLKIYLSTTNHRSISATAAS